MSGQARRQPRRSALSGLHPAVPAGPAQPTPTPPAPAAPETDPRPATRGSRVKATYNLDSEVVERARDAFWLAMISGKYRTLSEFIEDAVRRHIEMTMKEHNVEELPRRPGRLPVGRPIN